MAITYVPIASTVLTTTAANVTISSIPQTFTDLVLRISARSDSASVAFTGSIYTNSASGVNSYTYVNATSTPASARASNQNIPYWVTGSTAVANNFSTSEVYLPNYTSTAIKQMSIHGTVSDNAGSGGDQAMIAGRANDTAAVTSITIDVSGNFVAGSQFHLYGIKKD